MVEPINKVRFLGVYIIICMIGRAPNFEVYKIEHRDTGRICTVKVMDWKKGDPSIESEIEFIKSIKHPCMQEYLSHFFLEEQPDKIFLVHAFGEY